MQPEQTHEASQEITEETVQQFNKVCQSATQLMLSYKQQSEDLKNQISSMVNIYNKTADPSQAVPAEKIMEITNTYEQEMRSAHTEYQRLESELKREEEERNGMMGEIQECFAKLQKMEKLMIEKKMKEKEKEEKQKKEERCEEKAQ